MQIYDAIAFDKIIESGGSTFPWIVVVKNKEGKLEKFVVKLFTDRQIEQQNPVSKEIFGSILASEFSLFAPEFALINFSESFILTLSEGNQNILRLKNKGLKFGCQYIENAVIVNVNNQKPFWKTYDIGSIFALDNLIGNLDRGGFRNKPNLLVNSNEFILIDHEQIFTFADDINEFHNKIITNFQNGIWTYNASQHLFFSIIKGLKTEEKITIFDTFHEHLKNLDLNLIDKYKDFMVTHEISIGNYPLIKNYLFEIKNNSNSFIKLLKQSIS